LSLTPGTRVGAYAVTGTLGAGGMGEVYRAHDARLGRDVAMKVLPAEVAGDIDRLARFEREARTLASLNHPNIAHVYGFEERTADGNGPFLVMELLEGQPLSDVLGSGPVPPRKAIDYACQIARGLAAAHDRGIVHRDL
jgi:serine/threonine protein kinase